MTEYRKLADRIAEDGITSEATFVARSSGRVNDDAWTHDAWTVELTHEGRTMTVPFKMGEGLNGRAPEANEVLESILSDASGYYNTNGFEDWAREYGYDTDSRKAEATYNTVMEQTAQLSEFLGEKLNAYLWETEDD